MRDILTLMEAAIRKPGAAPDFKSLKSQVEGVIRTLSGGPFSIKMDPSIAMEIKEEAKAVEVQNKKGDPSFQMTKDDITEVVVRVWDREKRYLPFYAVRRDAEHEEEQYHIRAADRTGNVDNDPGLWIEGSGYLRAMNAEQEAAKSFDSLDINDFERFRRALTELERFAEIFSKEEVPSDDGESPIILESFAEGISKTLPVLLFRCSI